MIVIVAYVTKKITVNRKRLTLATPSGGIMTATLLKEETE